jgi:hypothetical protein
MLVDRIDRAKVCHCGKIERGTEDPGLHFGHNLARALGQDLALAEYESKRNAGKQRQHRRQRSDKGRHCSSSKTLISLLYHTRGELSIIKEEK